MWTESDTIASMWNAVRRPRNAEWEQVDRRLREYARHRSALDAAEAFDLVRAEQMKIYVCFGYATHYEYMERVLGYGPHAARERMRVARALTTLPETTAALARGEVTYSAVRELTRVATAETEADWLASTRGMVANQVERAVAQHRLGDRPEDPRRPDLRTRMTMGPPAHAPVAAKSPDPVLQRGPTRQDGVAEHEGSPSWDKQCETPRPGTP